MDRLAFQKPNKDELIEEALLLLVEIHPRLAQVFWLHAIEGWTQEELTKRFNVDERTIRKWIDGYERSDGKYIWGAKDWLTTILDLYRRAAQCSGFEEVKLSFLFARKANPWGAPFPKSLLDIFWQAVQADVLDGVLACLEEARRFKCYPQVIETLLDNFDRECLGDFFQFFKELCEMCPLYCVLPGEGL